MSVQVTDEMRIKLIAIGYLMGLGGEYAGPARNFLKDAIDDYVDSLEGRKKRDFEEILENVMIKESKNPLG